MEKKKYTETAIKSLIERFESRQLPKVEWTHEAHLIVAIWYNLKSTGDDVLRLTRDFISKHNEAVGTVNDDHGGYHETITGFWLWTAAQFIKFNHHLGVEPLCNQFIASGFGESSYPLNYYSEDLLFSVRARHHWVEPDLKNLDTLHYSREAAKAWMQESPGWENLIDIVYDNIPAHISISQVFQKWGSLKFDYRGEDENFDYLLERVADISEYMCEICGKSGRSSIIDQWETTLCDEHYQKSDAQQKYRAKL